MLTIMHFQYELLNYFEFFYIEKIKIEHYFSMIFKKKEKKKATIINYKEFILHLPNHLNNILT